MPNAEAVIINFLSALVWLDETVEL